MTDETTPWSVSADAFPSDGPRRAQFEFLLRYAILAPSSHNSQPWRFAVDEGGVDVFADPERWLPVADADKRELYLSVGCALENLLVAAERFGFVHEVEYLPTDDETHVARVVLSPDGSPSAHRGGLFDALTERSTNHGPYWGRISQQTLIKLEETVVDPDIWLRFVADDGTKSTLGELVTRADRRQFENPDYRRELGEWLGNGALEPSWLKAKLSQLAVTHLDLGERQAARDSVLVESAPLIVVLGSDGDSLGTRVRVGQTFERAALASTLEGLCVHPMSQVLELPDLRAEVSDLLGVRGDGVVQHLFRVGRAEPERGRSPRRPLSAVVD